MTDDRLPTVSIIVPAFNEGDRIRGCIESLLALTYPEEKLDVTVVDNGSTDGTAEIAREHPIQILVEDEVQSSYAARNRGIESTSGEVIAFTDADCEADPRWIEKGVQALLDEDADLVGGNISFTFSAKQTAAERFDAAVNMRNDIDVPENGVAKTANLLVRRDVIDAIGPFPEHLTSGGDVHWTRTATESGYRMVYAPDAIVNHPARTLRPLVRKHYRVGKGLARVWQLDERRTWRIVAGGIVGFPGKVLGFAIGENDGDQGRSADPPKSVDVYVVAVICVLAMNLGKLVQLGSSALGRDDADPA